MNTKLTGSAKIDLVSSVFCYPFVRSGWHMHDMGEWQVSRGRNKGRKCLANMGTRCCGDRQPTIFCTVSEQDPPLVSTMAVPTAGTFMVSPLFFSVDEDSESELDTLVFDSARLHTVSKSSEDDL